MNNEIKKLLYKEKPTAKRYGIGNTGEEYHYDASTSEGHVKFKVPIKEMGENLFEDELPAQLLIRWMV